MAEREPDREVYVSARGQHDNIGDVVLRRGLLAALRPAGRLNVNVVGLPAGYVAALHLAPEDRMVGDAGAWGRALTRGASGGYVYGFNAGETYASRAYAQHCLKMAPLLALSRARGGSAFHVGLGLRAQHRGWAGVLRAAFAVCDEVAWRDAVSRDWVGRGVVAADWAYHQGADTAHVLADADRRDLLAVSLRFDRPPPDAAWLDVVRQVARDRGLMVVAAPQVGRDTPRAAELASALGGDLLAWDGVDHVAQEAVVREVYARSAFVVSDRLHALVMGHTHGALPVGLVTASVGKLDRTLAAAGANDVAFEVGPVGVVGAVARIAAIEARRSELLAALATARSGLDDLVEAMTRRARRAERLRPTPARAVGSA